MQTTRVGKVDRVILSVNVRMETGWIGDQSRKRIPRQEAAGDGIVVAGTQVEQAGRVLRFPREAAVVVTRPAGQYRTERSVR